MRIAFAALAVLCLTSALKKSGKRRRNFSGPKSRNQVSQSPRLNLKTEAQCTSLRKTKKVYACPKYNRITSVVQREKGAVGLKKKCLQAGCCWFPFKDKSKRCFTSKNGYLLQRRALQKANKKQQKKPVVAKIPTLPPKTTATTTATTTIATTTTTSLPYSCTYDPLEKKLPCIGGQKSQEICESKNCCWHKKPLPGMRHRCLMPSTPSTHFPGAMDKKDTPAVSKREDQDKCVSAIEKRQIIGLAMCMDKLERLSDRKNCDTSEVRAANPKMSHCSACQRIGCCFDPKPKVKNGQIIPMCFNVSAVYLESIQLEKEKILNEQLEKLKQNVKKQETIMGIKQGGSRHRELLHQMYPGLVLDKDESNKTSTNETPPDNGYNSRVNGLLAMLGATGVKSEIPPPGGEQTTPWHQKPVVQDVMGTSTGGVKSDRLTALMGLMGTNGDNAKINQIRQFLDEQRSPKNNMQNPTVSISSQDEDHSRPRFKNQMYAQAYYQQLQNMERKLAMSGQDSIYVESQMKFYERAIDKMFKKYMVYTGKEEKTRVEIAKEKNLIPTTVKPTVTEKQDGNIAHIPIDEIAVVGTGEIPEDVSVVDSSIPYIQENHLIGNDEPGSCYPATCGNPVSDNYNQFSFLKKIAGGTPAGSAEYWPWQVSLRRFYENDPLYSHICGATLIADTWLLSAAHCFKKHVVKFKPMGQMEDQPDRYLAHFGRYSREAYEDSIQVRRIHSYTAHEKFNAAGSPVLYDIAVANFILPVRTTDWVKPACLPAMDSHAKPGMKMWITGWGETKGDIGGNNAHLKELSLPVATDEECRADWPNNWHEGWLCADTGLKEDACTGDSGGPAVQKMEDGRWRVIGVVSAGSEDCSTNKIKSAVFSSVVYFRQWIDRATGSLCAAKYG